LNSSGPQARGQSAGERSKPRVGGKPPYHGGERAERQSKRAARSGIIRRVMAGASTRTIGQGLSPEQVADFERNGFAGPFTALRPEAMSERYPSVLQALLQPSPVYGFPTPRDHHLGCRSLYELCSHPAIVERVASLLGPDLLLWRSTIFRKRPGAARVIWHQEHDFRGHRGTPALDPPSNITAWLAFTESHRENGCVRLFPASHHALLERRPVAKGTGIFGHDYVFGNLPDGKPLDMEVAPGQFFLFNEKVVHGSEPNTSASERSGISIRFTATSTRIHQGMRVDGQGLPLRRWHAILVRGEDAYGYNKLGPPPERDLHRLGGLRSGLGSLRHRWLRWRYGAR
jgi:non-heme Fe2+,alpha-ketoglutarate-dependent halogenase